MQYLCDYIKTELDDLDRKAKTSKLSVPELEYADTLAHLKKSLLTNEAMEDSGYSSRYPMSRYDGGMARGDSYGGMSYAGRRRRDSIGRYSSRDEMDALLDDMRGMMGDLPEDRRRKAERLIDELSR